MIVIWWLCCKVCKLVIFLLVGMGGVVVVKLLIKFLFS